MHNTDYENSQRLLSWHGLGIKFVSPLYLAILNMIMVLVAIFFPPSWFEAAAKEPDLVFLNAKYFFLTLICTCAFIAGIVIYRFLRGSHKIKFGASPKFYPSLGLLKKSSNILRVCLVINILTMVIAFYGIGLQNFSKSFTDKDIALAVRNQILVVGRIGGVNILALQTFVFVSLVIASFIYYSAKKDDNNRVVIRRFNVLFVFVVVTYLLVCVLTITRWPILQMSFAFLLTYILYRNSSVGLGVRRLFKMGLAFIIISLAVFLGIGTLKMGLSHVLGSVIGYTIASYNLGAAVVDGVFRVPTSGSTYATLGFFWQFPFLGYYFRQIGIANGLNLPVAGGANMTEVDAWARVITETTNLNPHWLWTTVYSYIYADVGWAFILVFLVYGAISQYLFENFNRLRLVHVSLYAFFFVYQIAWFTSVFISSTLLVDYFAFALIINMYIGAAWRRAVVAA